MKNLTRVFILLMLSFSLHVRAEEGEPIGDSPEADVIADQNSTAAEASAADETEKQIPVAEKTMAPVVEKKSASAAVTNDNAEDPMDDIIVEDTEDVQVITADKLYLPYRERREKHGWSAAIHMERILLSNYQSMVSRSSNGFDTAYKDLYGTEIVYLPTLRVGYKYNFELGALIGEFAYGKFDIIDNLSGNDHTLAVSRQSIGVTYVADMLFSEPTVAPYGSFNVYNMSISEQRTGPSRSNGSDTSYGFNYLLGLLVQMNGADPEAARNMLRDHGVQNSYIDLFVSKYGLTMSGDDPDTSTDFTWGAGLRFEF